MPVTFATYAIGMLALAGFPLVFSGFWSKDEILHAAHGWPVSQYDGLNDLAFKLTNGGAKCFEVHGVCGVHGFVFASSVEFRGRQSRAEVACEQGV